MRNPVGGGEPLSKNHPPPRPTPRPGGGRGEDKLSRCPPKEKKNAVAGERRPRRLKKEMILGADEAKFIRNGNAEIQIWLTDKSDETLVKLKALGFEVVLDPKSAKLVIGRLPIDKLAALAELKSVRYIAPQLSIKQGRTCAPRIKEGML